MSVRTRFAQRDGKRVAVRMDDRYWRTLDELARSRGQRTGELVWEVRDRLEASGNLTARLRALCVDHLQASRQAERLRAGPADLRRVADFCPSPCILVGEDGAALHFNGLARRIMARPDIENDNSPPSLTYMRQFVRIREFAAGRGGGALENVCLSKRGRTAIVRSIICLTSDDDSSLSLIFPLKRPTVTPNSGLQMARPDAPTGE